MSRGVPQTFENTHSTPVFSAAPRVPAWAHSLESVTLRPLGTRKDRACWVPEPPVQLGTHQPRALACFCLRESTPAARAPAPEGSPLQQRSSPTRCSAALACLPCGLPATQHARSHRVMPRLVAMMRTGAMSLSRARLRKEKLSMSSMWTSSINSTWGPSGGGHEIHLPRPLFSCEPPRAACRGLGQVLTPGMISALPSSRHSATLALICSRTSDLISPVSPAGCGGCQRGDRDPGPEAGR